MERLTNITDWSCEISSKGVSMVNNILNAEKCQRANSLCEQ